jgi:hypothetical protein
MAADWQLVDSESGRTVVEMLELADSVIFYLWLNARLQNQARHRLGRALAATDESGEFADFDPAQPKRSEGFSRLVESRNFVKTTLSRNLVANSDLSCGIFVKGVNARRKEAASSAASSSP